VSRFERSAEELFKELLSLDESATLEAKRGQGVGKAVMETISAFANEPQLGGGTILLGVRPGESNETSYVIEGVADPDQVSSDIASKCASLFAAPIRVKIHTEMLQGKPVIIVHVDEAAPHEKPVYIKSTGLPRGAFRRIGSADQRCTEDDLELFFSDRKRRSFDAGCVNDADLSDFDSATLDEYRDMRAKANPDAEELRWPDDELLQSLGATRRDKDDQWKPTVAGLFLFGKSSALRRLFPMTRVDYVRVPGRTWVPNADERFDTIEMRDSLFRVIRRIQAAVVDDLPKAFGLAEGALQRTEEPIIPHRALREALVNAVMHRSYRSHAPIQVIRYSNRLEIRNPGFSLKASEHLGEPGSYPRNPTIAAVLHDTRFAETKGSGIRAIRLEMKEAGLTPPIFESNRAKDMFTAQFLFHHFLSEDDVQWLARFKDLQLTDQEVRALVVVRETGAVDNSTYRELNNVHLHEASTALKRLRDAGLISQQGSGSATWYRPTDRLLGNNYETLLSGNLGGLSGNPDGLSGNLGDLSGNPDGLSDSPEANRREQLLDELPGNLAARIGALGKRQSPEKIRELVLLLCEVRAWSVQELAILLSRNPKTISQYYLRPLLVEERIEMTQPETPNTPTQAYRLRDQEKQ